MNGPAQSLIVDCRKPGEQVQRGATKREHRSRLRASPRSTFKCSNIDGSIGCGGPCPICRWPERSLSVNEGTVTSAARYAQMSIIHEREAGEWRGHAVSIRRPCPRTERKRPFVVRPISRWNPGKRRVQTRTDDKCTDTLRTSIPSVGFPRTVRRGARVLEMGVSAESDWTYLRKESVSKAGLVVASADGE
ncbi:hypothetical protein PYCCODRAFT_376088 [Trametes coccinea BRFM310]|uniref:Uncharacterized protein n=1 Tax=Trametes coccinea (strain BRFM310) TaxID=1353009 RepID=A0A1Y2J3J9_TRAC3|nr:hypothetical protein PYCCODRAFT_376088 [Trametes coccinea BRFM310]